MSETNSFSTQCLVEHTVEDGSDLEIEWYYRNGTAGSSREHMLTTTIQTTANCGLLKSELTVSLAGSQNDQGNRFYFCRVKLDGKKLNDSQEFQLHSPEIIRGARDACNVNQTMQSGLIRRCIAPMTQEQPEPTTTQTTRNVTTMSLLPTMLTLMPSATPESETSDPDVNSGNQGDGDDSNVVDAPLDTAEEILIYSAIGVAVFLFVVVSILVVCLCVCSSMFRQSKSCTCCGSDPPINSLSSSSNGRKLREKYMI